MDVQMKRDYSYNIGVLEKGLQAFIYIYYKSFDIQMFQPDWLILRILHQSFEIERQRSLIRGRGSSITVKDCVEQQRD